MDGEVVILRDGDGREHRAIRRSDGTIAVGDASLTVTEAPDGSLCVQGAMNTVAWTTIVNGTRWVFLEGQVFTFETARPGAVRTAAVHQAPLAAPMPATVRKLAVSAGDRVRRGDVLIVLEAMKMELPLRAPSDGRVRAVACREGDLVEPGRELVELE